VQLNGRMFNEFKKPTNCNKCNSMMLPVYNYVESNNSIQARCSNCGAFIQNMKHSLATTEVDNGEPTQKQLIFIKAFYSSKLMPKTKSLATEMIYIFNKVRGEHEL